MFGEEDETIQESLDGTRLRHYREQIFLKYLEKKYGVCDGEAEIDTDDPPEISETHDKFIMQGHRKLSEIRGHNMKSCT